MQHVQYKKAKSGKWYFIILAKNGKQLVSSQKTYESKHNAKIGFDALHEVLTGFNAGKELKRLEEV